MRAIVDSFGIEVVARELSQAPMRVQITLLNLVSRMSEMDTGVQELFGQYVVRSLVSLLGKGVDLEEFKNVNPRKATNSLHLLAMINKEMMEKESETELPEVKLMVKISCANALWKLAKGHLSNSSMITETKALLVLAKIVEKEDGELKMNCLMVLMELAAVAESNADLKCAVFRPNMTAPKVVLDQLLRVINEDTSATFVTTAIKATGCLASTFPAKEKRIIQSLVTQLDHENSDGYLKVSLVTL